jgi:hypothetical protein
MVPSYVTATELLFEDSNRLLYFIHRLHPLLHVETLLANARV